MAVTGWRAGARNPDPVITVDESGVYVSPGSGGAASGGLTDAKETNPDAASATIPALDRGQLYYLKSLDTFFASIDPADPLIAQLVDQNNDILLWVALQEVAARIDKQQPTLAWSYAAAAAGILNTTTAVTIKAAAGGSLRNYITGIQVTSEALTTATEIAIRDGAAGTVLWRSKIGTAGWINGREIEFKPARFGSANTLLEVVTLTASGAGAVYFNADGFVA